MMNACTFCKYGKRKCDKRRPSCSNCIRLRKDCAYTEDTIQTHFTAISEDAQPTFEIPSTSLLNNSLGIDIFSPERIQQYTVDTLVQYLGQPDDVHAMSTAFFTGTHQRIPALSKFRFYENFPSLTSRELRADYAALCLCMLLAQHPPPESMTIRPPIYGIVKNLISLLEVANIISIDLVHCKMLLAFYEMGHGLHAAAYVSIASCARTARLLGLHRRVKNRFDADCDLILMEEEKRAWWSVVIMDRFIGLCNRDDIFVTDDPERTDVLPIDDLVWSEGLVPADIEDLVLLPPSLDTPFNITVGQMARECQISNLAGRVIRHVFKPTPDPDFNANEAIQLERTLRAYLPLLAAEELKIGKYCAAFGICNSALYVLYDSMLSHNKMSQEMRNTIFKSIEETSLGAIAFAEASYSDQEGNYPIEIFSPYLPYSLCQSAIVQYRLLKQSEDQIHQQHIDSIKNILHNISKRWKVADQYITIIDNLSEVWQSLVVPHQGLAISTERARA